jgi:hypothetical protein
MCDVRGRCPGWVDARSLSIRSFTNRKFQFVACFVFSNVLSDQAMEKPTNKMGRPSAYTNAAAMPRLKEPTKAVVNQGRRAGQPKASCLSQRLDSAGARRPISSPLENKRESGGHKKKALISGGYSPCRLCPNRQGTSGAYAW